MYDKYILLTFWETWALSSKVTVSFYICTSNTWGFQVLYILTDTWCCQSFYFSYSGGFIGYLIVHLICVFLMTTDVTYLLCIFQSIYIYTYVYIFFYERSQVFHSFFIVLFVLLRYCLCILDTSLLQDVCFANIFLWYLIILFL